MPLSPEQLLEWADKVEEAVIADEVKMIFESFPVKFDPRTPTSAFKFERDCHGFEPPRDPQCSGPGYAHPPLGYTYDST